KMPENLRQPLAAPINQEGKLALLAKLNEHAETIPQRALVSRVLMSCFIKSCESGKSFTSLYAQRACEKASGNSPVGVLNVKNALYKMKRRVAEAPEEHGFSIINNPHTGTWQAVLLSQEDQTEDFDEDDTMPSRDELVRRAIDSARHIETGQSLSREETEFICDHVARASVRRGWTTTAEIIKSAQAAQIDLTPLKVNLFKARVQRVLKREEGRAALGFEIEGRGAEAFRFRFTDAYERTLVHHHHQAATYPVEVEGVEFDEDYYARTIGIWALGHTGSSSVTHKVLTLLSGCVVNGYQRAITKEYISKMLRVSLAKVAAAIRALRNMIKLNDWQIKIELIPKANAYYMTTNGDLDEDDDKGLGGIEYDELTINRILLEEKITLDDRPGTIVEQARQIRELFPITLQAKLDVVSIVKFLGEIIKERREASRRIMDSQRHFKIVTPGVEEIFEALAAQALRGGVFKTQDVLDAVKETAPNITRKHYEQIVLFMRKLNEKEPLFLGYEIANLANNSQMIRFRDEYKQAEISYSNVSSAYPEKIEDPEFKFWREVYDEAIEALLAKSEGLRESMTLNVLYELSTYSEKGVSISQRLLAKKMGVDENDVRRAMHLLKGKIKKTPGLKISIREGVKKTFYIKTIGSAEPPNPFQKKKRLKTPTNSLGKTS
ncbi:hypothetical protein HOE67_02495, partial [Candidatus Peregrinibacteria bacterium]|nr:hypothetical protein [Candidatus Peregrinibacteria bacterium]